MATYYNLGDNAQPEPAAYEPGRFYPPQAVMWADDAGVWHLRTGDAAEVA
jgi:hypothetical protein